MEKEAKKWAMVNFVGAIAGIIIGMIIWSVFIDEFKSGAARRLITWTSSYKDVLQAINVFFAIWVIACVIDLGVIVWKFQQSIKYTNEHVQNIDEQITLRKFVKCGVCSCAVSAEAGACPRCGELFAPKIAEKRNTGLRYCGQCGTALKENELYCIKCGNKVD